MTRDGEQNTFKITNMSGQWFLQKTSNKQINGRMKIDVHFACSILQKPLRDLKKNDRVTFAGKLFDAKNEVQNGFVVGVCKIDDLGSYVDGEKCSFTKIENNITAQQAATLAFPLIMSYHTFMNLLNDTPGKNVLIYHENEQICCIFAYVALSLGVKVVCLVKDRSSIERIRKTYDLVALTTAELARAELDAASSVEFDAVCLLSDNSSYFYSHIIKHIKSGATVVTLSGEKNVKFNPLVPDKDIRCIATNFQSITESSKNFEELFCSCWSLLKSKTSMERLLNIPQTVCSIYEIMNSEVKNIASGRGKEIGLSTVSMKPKNAPSEVAFYSLPLDGNGFKHDRTYLVIGGIRGFGFEVAKWMVENDR